MNATVYPFIQQYGPFLVAFIFVVVTVYLALPLHNTIGLGVLALGINYVIMRTKLPVSCVDDQVKYENRQLKENLTNIYQILSKDRTPEMQQNNTPLQQNNTPPTPATHNDFTVASDIKPYN